MSRRFPGSAAALLVLAVAACGSGPHRGQALNNFVKGLAPAGYRGCLSRVGHLTSAYGEDRVRFPDGVKVVVVLTPTPGDAQALAPLAGGPQDPYGYKAFGRAVIGWAGGTHDPHLLAVERCLR